MNKKIALLLVLSCATGMLFATVKVSTGIGENTTVVGYSFDDDTGDTHSATHVFTSAAFCLDALAVCNSGLTFNGGFQAAFPFSDMLISKTNNDKSATKRLSRSHELNFQTGMGYTFFHTRPFNLFLGLGFACSLGSYTFLDTDYDWNAFLIGGCGTLSADYTFGKHFGIIIASHIVYYPDAAELKAKSGGATTDKKSDFVRGATFNMRLGVDYKF